MQEALRYLSPTFLSRRTLAQIGETPLAGLTPTESSVEGRT